MDQLFALLCGRGHCFVVDGAPLPVCQRCLGLYGGAALTAAWLLVTGLWRRGLPARPIVVLQAALLVAVLLGGLHVLEAGPTWRLVCGLWTGHVALAWLAGAAGQMRAAGRAMCVASLHETDIRWPRRANLQAAAAPAVLALLALAFVRLQPPGRSAWVLLAAAGLAALAMAGLLALLAGAGTIRRLARRPG